MNTLHDDVHSDDPVFMESSCKTRRVSIPSNCPSYAEYVCSCLELNQGPVREAVWHAANTYLWKRVGEQEIRNGIRATLHNVLGIGDDVFVDHFLRELRQRRLEYFSRQWGNLDSVTAVCASDYQSWKADHEEIQRGEAQQVDLRVPVVSKSRWEENIKTTQSVHIVLAIVAPLCALCREIVPILNQIATSGSMHGVLLCQIDGSVDQVARDFDVARFPSLDLWFNGARIDRFSIQNPRDVEAISSWLSGHVGLKFETPTSWNSVFSPPEMAQLRISMSEQRRQSTVREALRAMGCTEQNECATMNRNDNPTVVLMGGGIASGKTTVAAALQDTEFWTKHGPDVVVVEADRFKSSDPLMEFMVRSGAPQSFAAREVHKESTSAAEKLFLDALSNQRDIIFDGTMKWSPFVIQTIDMIRNCHMYHYTRGPGFLGSQKNELYWIRGDLRDQPKRPYIIWLVAAYCNPVVSVGRSVRRAVLDQRGIPVQEMLLSHKWFAKHFATYVELVDQVSLYDNSKSRPLNPSSVATALPIIARKQQLGSALDIVDADAFAKFILCETINEKAHCASDLYGHNSMCSFENAVSDLEDHAAPPNEYVISRLLNSNTSKL